MLKTRTSPVILVSCLLTLVLLSSWASGGRTPPTADQLLQECIAGSGGAKRSSFTCSVLLATKESERAFSPNELAALTKVEEEVSNLSDNELRILQFFDDACSRIECGGLSLDKVRAIISDQLNTRLERVACIIRSSQSSLVPLRPLYRLLV